MELTGVFAPATTPFDPVTGDVDLIGMRANVRRWMQEPLAGVVLFGSTGEGVLLDEDEKVRLTAATRDLLDGDRLLLAGTGAESTRAAIRQARAVAEAGADAVLVQPPSFYKPLMTPAALRDHYRAVADASPIPVILYQVPPRFSGVELEPGLVNELARHPNITGIKDSSGDQRTLGNLVDACRGGCDVLAGSGAIMYAALEMGAVGGILAVALLLPRECAELCRAFGEERFGDAGRMQERIGPLHKAVVGELGIPGIKAALDALGMHGGAPRAPIQPLRNRDGGRLADALAIAGILPNPIAS
ncbi:MAG TPA: dihydrodipicolinate synthase family protein [Longimicrobium sp.]|uniref:dihydrodipicolinate synthase family protein n=1 Tax=Longimicrobium sp. TaxID=2029185 RepID=UPI002ED9FFE0